MAKYEVVTLLWSPSLNAYITPGAKIELDDELAKVLLEKQCIKPAVFRRVNKVKEVKDGSDN